MLIKNLTLSENSVYGYSSNCYLLASGSEAAVVDPSVETKLILNALDNAGLRLKYILLTHGHFDHMHTLDELRSATGAEVMVHTDDSETLTNSALSLFTYFGYPETVFQPASVLLSDGDSIKLGDEEITVIHTPGHTPGCVCYVTSSGIITGDTLFDMSVGRYDFPRSNGVKLRESIKRLYENYPAERIYPGHGPSSDMMTQIRKNPFTKGLVKF
ncbi:MAG: MBL fold metallo-hydrolase [Clostridia bacterium]|nr:MBL fold metallo-hydrolase [Clostridia bacterium]